MEANTSKNFTKGQKLILKILLSMLGILTVITIIVLIRYLILTSRGNLSLDQYIAHVASEGIVKSKYINYEIKDKYKCIYLDAGVYMNMLDVSITSTINTMEELTKDEEFLNMQDDGISFRWCVNLVDAYGNKSQKVGCVIDFSKDQFKQIKWENVTPDGIKLVAHKFQYDKRYMN